METLTDATQTTEMNIVKPWTRFWARNFDMLLHGIIIGAIWTFIHEDSFDSIPNDIYTVMYAIVWMMIEWGYMTKIGTTPGKFIMGIHVKTKNGERLSQDLAFKRARLVWLRGMAIGVGIIQLIANYIAYKNLKNDRATTWDRDLELHVTHKQIGLFRYLLCPSFVIVFMILVIVSAFIS